MKGTNLIVEELRALAIAAANDAKRRRVEQAADELLAATEAAYVQLCETPGGYLKNDCWMGGFISGLEAARAMLCCTDPHNAEMEGIFSLFAQKWLSAKVSFSEPKPGMLCGKIEFKD